MPVPSRPTRTCRLCGLHQTDNSVRVCAPCLDLVASPTAKAALALIDQIEQVCRNG
jgi:hypothetical protein